MLMISGIYFRAVKASAEKSDFKTVISVTDDQLEKQRHMELAVRFLVHAGIQYDGKLDVEEYIDEGIVKLATQGKHAEATRLLDKTFSLLNEAAGKDALRRFEGNKYVGKIGLVGLEGIAVGVAKNLNAILALKPDERKKFLKKKIQNFWSQPQTASFTSPGLRGTTRIQRTVPFGKTWFRP